MSMKKITKFVVYSEYLLCTLCTLHTVKRLFCCSSQLHVRAHDENQKMLVLLSYSGYFTFYMLLIHNKNAIIERESDIERDRVKEREREERVRAG